MSKNNLDEGKNKKSFILTDKRITQKVSLYFDKDIFERHHVVNNDFAGHLI